MKAQEVIDAVADLKAHWKKPQLSHVEVAGLAVLKQLASMNKVEMPMILDEERRQKFMDKIELLESYVESERGKAAIEFLVDSWDVHCAEREEAEEAIEEDETEGM